jgi:hypothetical protein
MMQAAEYGSLHNPVPGRQTVSVLVGWNLSEEIMTACSQQRSILDSVRSSFQAYDLLIL